MHLVVRSLMWSKSRCDGRSHVALWEHHLQEGIQVRRENQNDREYSS